MFRAGGVLFTVEPEAALTGPERAALLRLDPGEGRHEAPFRIALGEEPPWTSDDAGLFPQGEPAVLRWADGKLLSSHRSFTAEIDPLGGWARLFRREESSYPLETVIRTAMLARLPLEGGLPLHAAGIVLEGQGLAFFGPSGAGKTTLAGTSPHAVLSDELIAVVPAAPFALVRSGFWGEGRGPGRSPAAPLAALVDLARGPRFALNRLTPLEATRRLVGSVPVPLAPPLWSRSLAVLADLVARVAVYRMEWTPSEPPWERLAAVLKHGDARGL